VKAKSTPNLVITNAKTISLVSNRKLHRKMENLVAVVKVGMRGLTRKLRHCLPPSGHGWIGGLKFRREPP